MTNQWSQLCYLLNSKAWLQYLVVSAKVYRICLHDRLTFVHNLTWRKVHLRIIVRGYMIVEKCLLTLYVNTNIKRIKTLRSFEKFWIRRMDRQSRDECKSEELFAISLQYKGEIPSHAWLNGTGSIIINHVVRCGLVRLNVLYTFKLSVFVPYCWISLSILSVFLNRLTRKFTSSIYLFV